MFILILVSAFHFQSLHCILLILLITCIILLAEGWQPTLQWRVVWTGERREKPLTKYLHDSTTTTMVRHFKEDYFPSFFQRSTFRKGFCERILWRTAPGSLWGWWGGGGKAESFCRRRWSSHKGWFQNLLQTLRAFSKLRQVSQLWKSLLVFWNQYSIRFGDYQLLHCMLKLDAMCTHLHCIVYQICWSFWFRNQDGVVSDLEMTSKTQLAFKALDKNSDGFISKREFNEISKSLTKDQVVGIVLLIVVFFGFISKGNLLRSQYVITLHHYNN